MATFVYSQGHDSQLFATGGSWERSFHFDETKDRRYAKVERHSKNKGLFMLFRHETVAQLPTNDWYIKRTTCSIIYIKT